jgi:hypothetical protein
MARPEIDASAAELDLRMTEGDPIGFNFLVADASSWGGNTFRCDVKTQMSADAPVLASLTVTATADGTGCDILLSSAPIPALIAIDGHYYWDMQEDGGLTRFSGWLLVEPQVTE